MAEGEPTANSLGTKLRQLRKKNGWSLSELAGQIGSSKSHLSALETGLATEPSVRLLQRLATFHHVSIDFLLSPELLHPDNEADREFIALYRQQPPKLRAEVRDYFAARMTTGRRSSRFAGGKEGA